MKVILMKTDSGDDDGDDQEVDRKQHAQDRTNPVAAHLLLHHGIIIWGKGFGLKLTNKQTKG